MADNSSKVGRWAWVAALLIGGGVLFLAWDRFGFGGDKPLAGGQVLVDQAMGSSPLWTFADEKDPMTDEQVVSLKRQINADGFLIDTVISCRPSSGAITYSFTTFDANGGPAEALLQVPYGQPIPYHQAKIRADSEAAQYVTDGNPRYSNIFEFSSNEPWMLEADKLLVQLMLKQGEPLFVIDQTDKTLDSMIGECVQARQAIKEEQQAITQNHYAELEAEYRSLAAIPAAQITDQQRRKLTDLRFRLANTGKELPTPRADLDDAARASGANLRQDEEQAGAQAPETED